MKYLIGIPVLYGAEHCLAAIRSAKNAGDVLVIDNGADSDVKSMLSAYAEYITHIIQNHQNVYVNPAWNQIMKWFLENEQYDLLCIMNSDVVIPENTAALLDSFYSKYPNAIPLPIEGEAHPDGSGLTIQKVDGGIAGTFICLTRAQVKNVYPIPEYIKVWFGDNWLYDAHRKIGIDTLLLHELKIQHGNSRTVSIVPGISEIIEQDKIAWVNDVEPQMKNLVNMLKLEKENRCPSCQGCGCTFCDGFGVIL